MDSLPTTASQSQESTTSNPVHNNSNKTIPPEQRDHALGAATQVTSYETAGKPIGTNDPKKQTLQPNPLPAKHVAK